MSNSRPAGIPSYRRTLDDVECVLKPEVNDDPFVPITPTNIRRFRDRRKLDLVTLMREYREVWTDPLF